MTTPAFFCAGCNVREPWEHRCHSPQPCDCPDCGGRACACHECRAEPHRHSFTTRVFTTLGVTSRERTCSDCGETQRMMRGRWVTIRKPRPSIERATDRLAHDLGKIYTVLP